MGNRTISLDEISEGILKEWRKKEFFDFSSWIRGKMLEEYNLNHPKLPVKIIRHGQPPMNYMCENCKVFGHHWEERCPFPSKQEQMNKLRMRASRGEEE